MARDLCGRPIVIVPVVPDRSPWPPRGPSALARIMRVVFKTLSAIGHRTTQAIEPVIQSQVLESDDEARSDKPGMG